MKKDRMYVTTATFVTNKFLVRYLHLAISHALMVNIRTKRRVSI